MRGVAGARVNPHRPQGSPYGHIRELTLTVISEPSAPRHETMVVAKATESLHELVVRDVAAANRMLDLGGRPSDRSLDEPQALKNSFPYFRTTCHFSS